MGTDLDTFKSNIELLANINPNNETVYFSDSNSLKTEKRSGLRNFFRWLIHIFSCTCIPRNHKLDKLALQIIRDANAYIDEKKLTEHKKERLRQAISNLNSIIQKNGGSKTSRANILATIKKIAAVELKLIKKDITHQETQNRAVEPNLPKTADTDFENLSENELIATAKKFVVKKIEDPQLDLNKLASLIEKKVPFNRDHNLIYDTFFPYFSNSYQCQLLFNQEYKSSFDEIEENVFGIVNFKFQEEHFETLAQIAEKEIIHEATLSKEFLEHKGDIFAALIPYFSPDLQARIQSKVIEFSITNKNLWKKIDQLPEKLLEKASHLAQKQEFPSGLENYGSPQKKAAFVNGRPAGEFHFAEFLKDVCSKENTKELRDVIATLNPDFFNKLDEPLEAKEWEFIFQTLSVCPTDTHTNEMIISAIEALFKFKLVEQDEAKYVMEDLRNLLAQNRELPIDKCAAPIFLLLALTTNKLEDKVYEELLKKTVSQFNANLMKTFKNFFVYLFKKTDNKLLFSDCINWLQKAGVSSALVEIWSAGL